jgi:uncharacterized membrane protein HdeD (DUF308 family)
MSPALSAEEIRTGDELATALEKNWGWYLAGGILSVLFGFVILSFKLATLVAVDLFICAYFLALGIFEIVAAFRALSWRWLYVVGGVFSIGAGIVGLVWPGITLLVVAIIIGWTLLFWGIADLVHSLTNRHAPYWWLILIRGLLSIGLGIWALRHPGSALVVLVAVIGIWSVMFGVIEIIGSFEMRHARRRWEAVKTASA